MLRPLSCVALTFAAGVAQSPPAPFVIHVAQQRAQAPEEAVYAANLPDALDLLRQHRERGASDPARIVVHDGRYALTAPLVIDAALAGAQLDLTAAAGAAPLVTGGRQILGLSADDDGTWRTTLPAVRRGEWWFEEVFVDASPRTRARHPDTGFLRVVNAGADNRTSFTFDPTALPPARLDARAEIVFLHDWSTSRVRIASVDATTNTLTFADPIGCKAPHYAITNFERHPRFFVEGSPRLLDAPGEWALDRATGDFAYRPLPGEQLATTRLMAPVAQALLQIEGRPDAPVANVTVRGLRFAHASWPIPERGYAEGQAAFHEQRDQPEDNGTRTSVPAAIQLAWATNCTIARCEVAAVGGSGVSFGNGCHGCELIDSTVRDAGANGVMFGHSSATTATAAAGNSARHCLIERCGRRFFGAVGVWIGLAQRITIANCEIRDLPYTGVSVGWRWDPSPTPCRGNVIADNHIHHVMQMLSDGGGIYTLGWQPGTELRGNAIHDVRKNAGRAPSNGMFLDQGTKGLTIAGNVIWGIDTTPLRWHMSHENVVCDNTLVLTPGQKIAHYNRAKAGDITYRDNTTPDGAAWSPAAAAAIMTGAGVRSR